MGKVAKTIYSYLLFFIFTSQLMQCLGAALLTVPSAEYPTIQSCANAAKPGDTCNISTGEYNEYIQVRNGGVLNNPIVFKANGKVVLQGFRLLAPYITVDGFEMTTYAVGLSPAHVTVEPSGDYCTIKNNTFRDGVKLLSSQYIFDSAANTITNPSGGFLNAGFVPNTRFYIASNINNEIGNANIVRTIKSVTDTTLTIQDAETLVSEGPSLALLYATRVGKSGVHGITFILNSRDGAASSCHVVENTFRNLGGSIIDIAGDHHVIEKNLIEQANGWQIFDLQGHDNVIRYNHVRNSPRYPGFAPPDGSGPDQSQGGHWDFVAQMLRSFGSTSIEGHDNYFEFNFIENIDNELFNITEKSPVTVSNGVIIYDSLPTRRFTFRNNVIYGLEMHGAIHRPDSIVENNTFIKSNPDGGAMFAVSSGYLPRDVGSAEGAIIRNNAFIEVGKQPDPNGQNGWYHVENVSDYSTNYNYVSGAIADGYPRKDGFNKEANGINGGNPQFRNIHDLLGPDGIPFTLDDGLKPTPGSPLCQSGEDQTDVGAYSCAPDKVFAENPQAVDPDVDPDAENTTQNNQFKKFINIFNPAESSLEIAADIQSPDFSLSVYDRGGRLIRKLHEGFYSGDPSARFSWNGRNESNEMVSSGVYILQLKSKGQDVVRKVVVIK